MENNLFIMIFVQIIFIITKIINKKYGKALESNLACKIDSVNLKFEKIKYLKKNIDFMVLKSEIWRGKILVNLPKEITLTVKESGFGLANA